MSVKIPITIDFISDDLSESKLSLLSALFEAHRIAATNNQNVSKMVSAMTYRASGNFAKSAASAIMTIGDFHAPISAARKVLMNDDLDGISDAAKTGIIIPGFGNSFFKDCIDPAFRPVMDILMTEYLEMFTRIEDIQKTLWRAGKQLFPNAAIITAAVCEIINIPKGIEESLFILARLPVWAMDATKQNKAILWDSSH